MRHLTLLILFCILFACSESSKKLSFSSVRIETVFEDSVSIRVIEFLDKNTLAFAGSSGIYGTVDIPTGKIRSNIMKFHTVIPEFRSVAHTSNDFFMLSVGNPALLYKTGDNGRMNLVYIEEGDAVFYDAINFWNDREGVAVGDNTDGCLSIIITRDGGNTWNKLPCNVLPEFMEGEGAFAASNTNIKIIGDKTWIATTKRILYSMDKGETWTSFKTPVKTDETSEGIFSIDFYDENVGVAIGGDFAKPDGNLANKAITEDGGKTWQLLADGKEPGYKSCIRFVPNSGGNGLVAIGFTGISYSKDRGATWERLSKEGFYTIRFLNDSTAYAAGKNRIAKLSFR
ncbi:WD40/YVTN/BNR-like repeat-containing protein [Maribacter sp. 2210JD10-5]|uniref:WD40/YVTN/BNR-like repeat-containing protein n=1 Tax=Maribacter sp. 2210JD10-5 TaxID=3386272 RepID=UPI0039BCD82E